MYYIVKERQMTKQEAIEELERAKLQDPDKADNIDILIGKLKEAQE